MEIKICGMTDPANVAEISKLKPTYMGFIFHEPSPRYAAKNIMECLEVLNHGITPVAVVVNRGFDAIMSLHRLTGIKHFQLHGDESPQLCQHLVSHGFTIFKAINVGAEIDNSKLQEYADAGVSMFVFDAKGPRPGGNGTKFNWCMLQEYNLSTPYLLSGGIDPADSHLIRSLRLPGMVGIDLNSLFESQPGIKNFNTLNSFIHKLNEPY